MKIEICYRQTYPGTEFINPKESDKPVSELIKETTGGLGVDYCYECTGVLELLNEAIEGSKVGLGTIVFIGAGLHLSGELKYIPLLCGRTIKGSIYGGSAYLSRLWIHEVCRRLQPEATGMLALDYRIFVDRKEFVQTGNTNVCPDENESLTVPCILAPLSVDGCFPVTFAKITQMNGGSSAEGIAGDENGTLVTGESLETECFGKAVEGQRRKEYIFLPCDFFMGVRELQDQTV
ncbi:alcohol dehydrogenase [Olea europaea subsp. europaea]|uniref:Alcohol dehydrogenase, partial n=1 Tax=Olea europaea subsp. europaea TaxID=158383 RepID=A0A8S0SU78_OLEEU|nr:alcohol dehydrogenase [Olea europaea subsp. europaea]